MPFHAEDVRDGSSPLARGLLLRLSPRDQPVRIIPARAGFTRVWLAGDAGRWDHPRSRGVYPVGAAPQVGESGSSPLARGLQSAVAVHADDVGIIPARAGFTFCSPPSALVKPDHPRSRGVYLYDMRSPQPASGSSPLARGLPGDLRAVRNHKRIIPACAGFTGREPPSVRRPPDHPRSRGVYAWKEWDPKEHVGSSPLARGLPGGQDLTIGAGRIIPARAGFTQEPGEEFTGGQDHPRSRGVYLVRCLRRLCSLGSSPLARGLPLTLHQDIRAQRIIPARAGFTAMSWRPSGWGRDHPRSRGVYVRRLDRPRRWYGSSPLARGLPEDTGSPGAVRRIIPARAGFTTSTPNAPGHQTDHPRSRGVYFGPGSFQ